MGFYGNITNTSRTSFSFDKVYSNRYDMDTSCSSDGIYSGRYVLVEYDSILSEDTYPKYYYYDGKMYGSVNKATMLNKKDYIESPEEISLYAGNNIGQIVRIPINGMAIIDLNKEGKKESEYIRINSINNNEYGYTGISRDEYENGLRHEWTKVEVNADTFDGTKLYIYDSFNSNYVLVGEYTYAKNMSGSEYAKHVGTSVRSEDGVWVYVKTSTVTGDSLETYAPLGLGGTVEDCGQEILWSAWWKKYFGKSSFDYQDELFGDKYYYKSSYIEGTEYFSLMSDIYTPVSISQEEFEQYLYYYHGDANDNTKFILAERYNSSIEYYVKGIQPDVFITNDSLGISESVEIGTCLRVPMSHRYRTNSDAVTYFMCSGLDEWIELTNTKDSVYKTAADSNFLTNFAIDTAEYGTSRGYDSTVWQKAYSNGTEKYVMIAELNSVVPTFDLSADAPTMSPMTPHFDSDSTNVYYKLHWQPSWGLRTKAASNALLGVEIAQDGSVGLSPNTKLTKDEVIYPSDESTQWRADFYDTTTDVLNMTTEEREKYLGKYYNTVTSRWDTKEKDDERAQIPAAIYYNLDGFDSNNVAYSKDIIDEKQKERYNDSIAKSGWKNKDAITLAPTGVSGHLYNKHDGTIDQATSADTQELSVMLPSLGDTIASMWDMVFGGRNTNTEIFKTNERNTDISWENAKASLDRHGLRLVNLNETRDGYEVDSYATAEVNTIAGAINSAHDLMGMIITTGTEDGLTLRIDELDENRIYHNETDGKYYRKHKTYDYEEKDNSQNNAFTYTPVTEEIAKEEFDPAGYYIQTENGYEVVPEGAKYDPFTTYYTRTGEVYDSVGELTFFDGSKYYYMDYTGSDLDKDPYSHLELMDYIKNPKYQQNHMYYTIDNNGITIKYLNDGYKANKYFYINPDNEYFLDSGESAYPGREYYDIKSDKVVDITDDGYNGIYKPGTYYYWDDIEKAFRLDQNTTVTPGTTYFIPSIKKTEIVTDENGEQKEVNYVAQVDYQEHIPENEDEFNAKEFFYMVNEETQSYSVYGKTYDEYLIEQPILYLKSIKYVIADDETVTIDTNSPFTLVQFYEDAFFFELRDSNNNLIGYRPVTLDMVDPTDSTLIYKGFVNGHTGGNNYADWCYPICPFKVRPGMLEDAENYACRPLSDLYFPNTYHYKDKNGSYILDTYGKMTHDIYYLIDKDAIKKVPDEIKFFEPYEYYIYNPETGRYEKVTEDLTEDDLKDKEFFNKQQLYVLEDKLHIYEPGAEWNPYALKEPDTVKLATRKARWELKEIPNFAVNLNTLNGLILKTNNYLEFDDTYTRDERIANGMLNQIKDIIAKIDKLIPRNFATVDDYGRINATDWDTRQAETSTEEKTYPLMKDSKGDVFEEVEKLEDMRKQWITLNLDGNALNPKLTVHHNYQHVTDTVSDFDMNAVSTDDRKMITDIIETPLFDSDGAPIVDSEGNQVIQVTENTHLDEDEINEGVNKPSYVTDDSANKVELYTPTVDDMGHIVGHNTHTLTLPFNFKTYHIAEQSESVEDIVENAGLIIADNTQDNLTLASGNKWVKMAADLDTDTITIGHEVHEFTSGESNTQYGLHIDKVLRLSDIPVALELDENGEEIPSTGEEEDTGEENTPVIITEVLLDDDNTFEVPNFTFDEAGHILQAETHKVVLPENFESISIFGSDITNEDSVKGSANSLEEVVITADSLIDNLTIKEGNRWINLDVDADNDTVAVKHYIKQFTETTSLIDFNTPETPSFDLQKITWDEAGHVISSNKVTYTLPYDFKTITALNDGANNSSISIPGSNGSLIAKNNIDEAKIKTGNRWLSLSTDLTTNTMSIQHTGAGTATADRTKGVHAAQTPNFGDTFTVPTVGIDEAGHVANLTENTVKIPMPSLVPGIGNVVTGITLDQLTGKITEKKDNVGNLTLDGYVLGTNYNLIKNTDTIIEAFSKVQLQIKNVTTFLDASDNNESTVNLSVEPNCTYKLGEPIKNLSIEFNDKDVNYYAEYRIIFTTDANNAVLAIPASYTWDGDEPPTLEAKKKYIVTTDNITHIVTISKGVKVV